MKVTNNITNYYYQTRKMAMPTGKFSEVMADAMNSKKRLRVLLLRKLVRRQKKARLI